MSTDNKFRFLNSHASLIKYYENAKYSIEDPIFTGFTLDIDTLHSPLFYALAGTEYNESLRTKSGENTELSNLIEEKLERVYKYSIIGSPNSYEINNLEVKSELNGERRAGYGLQESYYLDNVLYGAVDYIYMVDKVSISKYSNEFGVEDIGNGTPDSLLAAQTNLLTNANNAFEQRLSQIQQSVDEYKEPDGFIEIEEEEIEEEPLPTIPHLRDKMALDEAKDKQDKFINDPENKNKYNQKKNTLTSVKEEYESLLKDSDGKTIDDYTAEIKKIDTEFSKIKKTCKEELSKKQEEMEKLSNTLNKTDIDNKYEEVKELIKKYEDSKEDYIISFVKFDPEKDNFDNEKKALPDYIKRELNENIGKENLYKKIWTVQKTRIKDITLSPEKQRKLQEFKDKREKLSVTLYGKSGLKENPSEDSPYYKVLKAENELQNDPVQQAIYKKEAIEETKKNLDTVKDYYNYISEEHKKNISQTQSNLPSFDASNGRDESRQTFEVPQTVYDMMGFINGMKDLTTKYPYYLQSITGLDEAYKNYFEVKDPYMGSGDNKITITCLESIDLRITSMFNKYFNAVYDRQYRRERVPVNLRRFQCSIFVHDIRNFKDSLAKDYNQRIQDRAIGVVDLLATALNYVSAIEFKFFDCEIIPEETGNLFDNVSNISAGDMRNTNFTFKYGNCVINFLPYDDVKKYVLNDKNMFVPQITKNIETNLKYDSVTGKPITEVSSVEKKEEKSNTFKSDDPGFKEYKEKVLSSNSPIQSQNRDSNFRRWFDRSTLGNVNNNDYRDYIRHDSSVAVDDHYKTTIVNNFALNSVVDKNKELTVMDDALRRIIIGISASTGVPTEGVADALNVRNIIPYLTEQDKAVAVVKDLGNMTNSKIIDTKTTEYIGTVIGEEKPGPEIVKDLGNVNTKKGGN